MSKIFKSILFVITFPYFIFAKPLASERTTTEATTPTSMAQINYQTIYIVSNIDKIPRYVQDTRDGERDSNICYAAAAAQAIDLHRYNNLNVNRANFVPSSPVLLASRVQHIRGARDGQMGGPPNQTMEQSFRFGNCSTLAPQSSYNDGVLRVEEEMSAIASARTPNGTAYGSRRQLQNGVYENAHADFFSRTYTLCQPGSGAAFRQDENFGAFSLENNGQVVTDEQWLTALRTAHQPAQASLGVQAIAISSCAEILTNEDPTEENCSKHAMTILGKRCPNSEAANNIATGGCQVLIRDSYLHDAATLPPGGAFYDGIPNDRSDIWVSEARVKNWTKLLHMIGRAPSTLSPQRIGYGERARQNRENEQREQQPPSPDDENE